MLRTLTSVIASTTLLVSTTSIAAAAQQPNRSKLQAAASQSLAQQRANNPWFMLSAMSSTRSIVFRDAKTTAELAQPPAQRRRGELIGMVPYFSLIILALMAIDSEKGQPVSGRPISPF